ncbi:ABC transporter permease [Clostridium celatum]|uniref:ABC transporter, permease protein n=1 Tax=Clostridium celatum DSM 1785 TaxID=545697 RepID=L1Q6A4_9CLOT|nr:ABC transporter permease subunit [Clostridium celatum]EKY23250.1 ABC transporter, permease protein [Clostridium celatum DSM 1785]MCE9656001.1 ABC transporter permease subunit [Clostridium celatum]MDU2264897.1 ABC transporter permease subunit [Clostridium celatum]MDU3722128.1 ABC transporter permease subunit [Clostridium celatum]MDU6294491.1 ABC transporter permease subunit [Clostridium celatum]
MNNLKKVWSFIKGFIIFNIIWYICALIMNSRVLPTPDKIYLHLPKLFKEGFYIHILASLYRIIIGLLISFIIGSIIGLLMGYFKKLNSLLNPLVYFVYPIPKTALLPVVMTLYGLGDGSKITIIVLITVFQVIVSVRDAVINVDKVNYNPLISLGASKLQLFYHVTFPAILAEILTNIRLSIGTAFSILFFAEAYGTSAGVGYFIQDSWTRINYIDMYSGIVILSLLGLILFIILDYIESVLCKWKRC